MKGQDKIALVEVRDVDGPATTGRRVLLISALMIGIAALAVGVAAFTEANNQSEQVAHMEDMLFLDAQAKNLQSHMARVSAVLDSSAYCKTSVDASSGCASITSTVNYLTTQFGNVTSNAGLVAAVSADTNTGNTRVVVFNNRENTVMASTSNVNAPVGQPHPLANPSACTVHYGDHVCGYHHEGKPVILMGDFRKDRARRCFCIIGNCCNTGGGDHTSLNGDSVSVSPS